MKAIQKELGETDDLLLEVEEMREQIEKANMPEKVHAVAEKETQSPLQNALSLPRVNSFPKLP